MLSSCANGTFLLRFSDSELGGVTIAWVGGKLYFINFHICNQCGIIADKSGIMVI